ncbi:Hsp70 family protein [Skermania piniformis]|uniref:Hsp70 family protein n=1 Tax=Skermania pinensis TaxID=39122 RepID=A0ABX8SA76_9ACTN|nr:Hsp70 family protein [Skermania piniformis]QXQ14722.1 Hsp70 family protein [Skermania piniformis]
MVLVLGVSAGASGARGIVAHSDQPQLSPIDSCVVPRRSGGGVEDSALRAVALMRAAAAERSELISATAITYRTEAQADAIEAAVGSPGRHQHVRVVNEAEAQLRYLRLTEQLPTSGSIILYDLGSSGLTLTLADCDSDTVIATRRNTVIGGDSYDALLRWRLARAGVTADPALCRRYREALSTVRVVTAEDPASGGRVVVTRADFDDLVAAGVHHSASLIRQILDENGRTPDGVVLVGGCVHTPSIERALRSALHVRVSTAPEPATVSARGAVLLAGDRPTRVVRVVRAIGGGARPPKPTPSRRKVLAALAITGMLGITVGGVTLLNQVDQPADQGGTSATQMEVAGIPKDPFDR